MTSTQRLTLKKFWPWLLIVVFTFITAYITFILLVSAWIGITHTQQAGFWLPILTAITFLTPTIWAYIVILRSIRPHMKDDDVVNI